MRQSLRAHERPHGAPLLRILADAPLSASTLSHANAQSIGELAAWQQWTRSSVHATPLSELPRGLKWPPSPEDELPEDELTEYFWGQGVRRIANGRWVVDMMQGERAERTDQIAKEVLNVLGTGRQIAPFSSRYPAFDLAQAYDVAAQVRDLRRARGEHTIGRKIGFTNRAAWGGYGISGPIWNYVFDSTVSDLTAANETFTLRGLPEPRIEPEIVLHLASAPHADMSEHELFGCVDWIAHGFEVVHSIFPGWAFTAADAVAAYGVHGALLLGDRQAVSGEPQQWAEALSSFTVELVGDDGVSRSGRGDNVLGGPLQALRFLVEELARYPSSESLRSGELVATGTLTEAMPVVVGESWSTRLSGIDIHGLRLRFR